MSSSVPIQTLLETIKQTLSQNQQNTSSQELSVSNSNQLLVLTIHSILSSSSFQLDNQDESNWKFPSSEPYRLIYRHSDTEYKYELKFVSLGKKLTVYSILVDRDETYSLELDPTQILNTNLNFPLPLNQLDNNEIFSTQTQLEKLIEQIHNSIIFKLIPQLQQASNRGTSVLLESSHPATPTSRNSETRDDPLNDPLRDESFIPSNLGRYRDHPDLGIPRVGASDLDPLGGGAFSGPRFGGLGGNMDPYAGIGGGLGNDGMYVGPNHPIFNRQRPQHDTPHGGPETLPPGAIPPGARFDPIGPFSGPNRGGMRGPNPGSRFSGDPDNDDLPPPGYNDMFM